MKKIKILFLTAVLTVLMTAPVFANGFSIFKNRQSVNQKVIVLMYHMISEVPEYKNTYCINPKDLEADISYLKNNNFAFSTLKDLENTKRLYPDKNIAVLTFDDGYESDLKYVLPLLKKYDITATFFISSSLLGTPFYMTESQLKELSLSGYAEIGNHSNKLHSKTLEELIYFYSDVANMGEIIADFKTNKAYLEKLTGTSVVSLSYPNSVYNALSDMTLKNLGICRFSLSTEEKSYNPYKKYEPIGRYNRSDLRTAQDIVTNILKKY